MARGNTFVHYSGKNDDFIVMVTSEDSVKQWKKDKSIPLTDVLDGYGVFVTHKHGTQGIFDHASHASMSDEFGAQDREEAIKTILEQGVPQTRKDPERRGGDKNLADGPMVAH
jgi:ribosome maturation protein Sdo1